MTFPTFSAAMRALEERCPHLLALPMNDPLIRASFDEVERQQLERVHRAVFRRPMSVQRDVRDVERESRPFHCPMVLHIAEVDHHAACASHFETWTAFWVHLMTCPAFRRYAENYTPQPAERHGYDVG